MTIPIAYTGSIIAMIPPPIPLEPVSAAGTSPRAPGGGLTPAGIGLPRFIIWGGISVSDYNIKLVIGDKSCTSGNLRVGQKQTGTVVTVVAQVGLNLLYNIMQSTALSDLDIVLP